MVSTSKNGRAYSAGRCGKAFAFAVVAMMIAAALVIVIPMERSVADEPVSIHEGGMQFATGGPSYSETGLSWNGEEGKLVLDNFSLFSTDVSGVLSYGMSFHGDVTIEVHGTNSIIVDALENSTLSCIDSNGNLKICGDGTLNLHAVSSTSSVTDVNIYCIDMMAGKLVIDGATVNIDVSSASGKIGSIICCEGGYDGIEMVNGATLTANAGDVELDEGSHVRGISAIGTIRITDSKVNIDLGRQIGSVGILSLYEDIVVKKSDVRISATDSAFQAYSVKITDYNSLLGSKVAGEEPTENLSGVRDLTQYKVVWSVYSYNELASGMFVLLGIVFAILVIVAGAYIRKDRH